MRLLLVEDSQRLQELLGESFASAGYKLDIASTVEELFRIVKVLNYDLLIVDHGLPDCDELSAIKRLRTQGTATPILIITARGGVDDRIGGLDSGADDYLIKALQSLRAAGA